MSGAPTLFDFADVPAPARPEPQQTPAPVGLVAGGAVPLRCACGAWAMYGFGVSLLNNKPGLWMCAPCARADGRLGDPS